MKTALIVIAMTLFGGFAGYMLGVYIACFVLYPDSNQCGFVGVFLTGPVGLVLGLIIGIWLAKRNKR